MDLKVNSEIPGVYIGAKHNPDGSITIILAKRKESSKPKKENFKTLGKVAPGTTFMIGNREYLVLGHGTDTTAVIANQNVGEFAYHGSDYPTSGIRMWLNTVFYTELAGLIGSENIIEHRVNLMREDGTGKKNSCRDNVSLITMENFRRYSEYLRRTKGIWTATQNSEHDYGFLVIDDKGVPSVGIPNGDKFGVRPFCILSSNIKLTSSI